MLESKSILIVAHNINFGGAAVACKRLLAALKNCHAQPAMILAKYPQDSEQKRHFLSIKNLGLALLSRLDYLICMFLENENPHWKSTGLFGLISSRTIQKRNPSFVNIHWVGHSTISLTQIAKISVPTVITAHDEWWLHSISHYSPSRSEIMNKSLRKEILSRLEKKKENILRRPNVGIVCLSNEMKDKFIERYPFLGGRIRVIPNPIDPVVFHPVNSFRKNELTPRVAYLGGFDDLRKGFDLLLAALTLCEESFHVFAPGFKGEVSTGIAGQIRLVGIPKIIGDSNLNDFYNSVDITVVPSRQEAFSLVAAESLMSGTPVIAFRVGGLRDMLIRGKTGVLVESFNVETFAAELDLCIKNSVKGKWKTRKYAEGSFSEKRVASEYLAFFKFLLVKQES